jgi:hypothetical protein
VISDWTPRRTVSFELDLPAELAAEVERLQHHDPALLQRMFTYAMLRAAVVEGLKEGGRAQKLHRNA